MNVQQTIIKGIKELLFFHNYLVLPNFGGFVLKSSPSHFSASGGLLVSPSKTVSFNVQLKQNDGTLAIWLQNALKCDASEAVAHLKDFSEFCSGILNAKRRLSLEGIGFFYLDFENNICFEPQQDSNFLSSSFGLAAVSVKELEPELAEIKKETVFVDRTLHTEEKIIPSVKRRRNYSKLIAPLVVTILFASLLGLLVSNSAIKGELKSSLFGTDSKTLYSPTNYSELNLASVTTKAPTYVADANGIATIELENGKKIAVKAVENLFSSSYLNTSLSNSKSYSTPAGKFEIVMGCFTVLENAKRMVKKLSSKKIRAKVTGQNEKGMFVVGSGNFASREDAVTKLVEIKNDFPNAWIKKSE